MKTITKIVVILAAAVMTAGCATRPAYDAYGCAYPNYGGAVIGGLAGGLLGAQIGSGHRRRDRNDDTAKHRTGVEPCLEPHQADTRFIVTGEQCPLDRRRATPARQQREVHVDHRHHVEHVRLDQLTERHHHPQVGGDPEDIVDSV